MIKESEIVTKEYLSRELAIFRSEMRAEMKLGFKEQKIEIIREVRSMIHETMEGAMENMKAHYEKEMKHYMQALLEGFRDEMRVYKDGLKIFSYKIDDHEGRIGILEAKAS